MKHHEYSLGAVLSDAQKKGFTGLELVAIQREYVQALSAYEERLKPPKDPNLVVLYLEAKQQSAYRAAERYKVKRIDEIQRQ